MTKKSNATKHLRGQPGNAGQFRDKPRPAQPTPPGISSSSGTADRTPDEDAPGVRYTVYVAHERTHMVEVGTYTVPAFGGERIAGHDAIRSGDIDAELIPADVWDRDTDRINLGDDWGNNGELRCELADGHQLIVEGPDARTAREELEALHRRHWEEAGR